MNVKIRHLMNVHLRLTGSTLRKIRLKIPTKETKIILTMFKDQGQIAKKFYKNKKTHGRCMQINFFYLVIIVYLIKSCASSVVLKRILWFIFVLSSHITYTFSASLYL
jgi:hypothetical protein